MDQDAYLQCTTTVQSLSAALDNLGARLSNFEKGCKSTSSVVPMTLIVSTGLLVITCVMGLMQFTHQYWHGYRTNPTLLRQKIAQYIHWMQTAKEYLQFAFEGREEKPEFFHARMLLHENEILLQFLRDAGHRIWTEGELLQLPTNCDYIHKRNCFKTLEPLERFVVFARDCVDKMRIGQEAAKKRRGRCSGKSVSKWGRIDDGVGGYQATSGTTGLRSTYNEEYDDPGPVRLDSRGHYADTCQSLEDQESYELRMSYLHELKQLFRLKRENVEKYGRVTKHHEVV